jgi:hypothetical protein
VSVPTEALIGTEKPTPSRMMSPSDERCGPWLAVMIADVVAAQAQVLVEDSGHAGRRRPSPGRCTGRRVRSSSLGSLCRVVVARRPLTATRVAMVATSPVPPDPARHLIAEVAAALAELPPERAELARRRVELPP